MAWSDDLEEGTPAYEIAASLNEHVRVVAGPGTGKSYAMKRRVARLLENGVDSQSILPVTFTRVAAEDLHRELVGMQVPGCEGLEGKTLHSLALRTLMRHHVLTATGRVPRPLNIFEIKPLESDLAARHGGLKNVRERMSAYESAWARLQHDDPGYVQSQEDADFQIDLLSWLRFHSAMLIGEVIPQLHAYLSGNPAAQERTEYSHILVDEYQDLNKAEQGVIDLLSDNAEVCIVGDDDQSIYSFKHAHPEGIQDWTEAHEDAADLSLYDCRRCPTQVVEMANALIANNVSHPEERVLVPMPANGPGVVQIIQYQHLEEEILGVANMISDMVDQGVPPGDIIVLAQRGAIGTPIYEELVQREIPAESYYAQAELDAEEAQRRFALLKLFVDREDRVALRWMLGLGSNNWRTGSYRRLRDYCDENETTPWQALMQVEADDIKIPYVGVLAGRFSAIRNEIVQLENLVADNKLAPVVDCLFPEGDPLVRDIRALSLKALESVGGKDREEFLRELTSAIARPEVPSEIAEVRIMSLHKSKGLSAPVTFVAGCVEGLLPQQPKATLPQVVQDASLEEQRRLFYVGISRVKASPANDKPGTLVLTYSQAMPLATAMGAGLSPAQVNYGTAYLLASRFIQEMGQAAPAPIAGGPH